VDAVQALQQRNRLLQRDLDSLRAKHEGGRLSSIAARVLPGCGSLGWVPARTAGANLLQTLTFFLFLYASLMQRCSAA
jgi:hypothetical protein